MLLHGGGGGQLSTGTAHKEPQPTKNYPGGPLKFSASKKSRHLVDLRGNKFIKFDEKCLSEQC